MKIRVLIFIVIGSLSVYFGFNFVQAQRTKNNASQITHAESNWDQAAYEAWKKEKEAAWRKADNNELSKQINDLMVVLTNLTGESEQKQALYAYNFVREFLKQPLEQKINKEWLDKVRKDSKTFAVIESRKEEFALPTIAQKELVQEAQVITGLLDERAIISRSGAGCGIEYIAVRQAVDLDEMLFGIYHELGHINYGDVDLMGTKTHFEKLEPYELGQTLQGFAAEHPKLNAQLDKMAEYVAIAKKQLNTTSEIGKILIEEIKKTATFWNPPQDPKEYIETAIGRAQEFRADLFAVEQLLKQKRLDSVLFRIRDFGISHKAYFDYRTIEGDQDVHPSFLERVLYMAGYLFLKGIDVNNELKRWENFGICTDVRKMHGPWSRLHEKEMSAFEQAYKLKEKELMELDYKLWKKNKALQQVLLYSSSSSGQQKELFHEVKRLLADLQENPENRSKQKETLFAYNYLRELNNEPMIESIGQIDKKWLKQVQK